MSITMTPQTSIRLVNVPFDSDEKHTLYFENKSSQLAYFNGLTGYSLSDYTYVKKDSSIKIGLNYELAKRYNYLYYTNYRQTISDQGLTGSPMTVFCFIVGMEYINENTTKLYIKTDNFQTYLTEILSDSTSISYIERQHVRKSDDIIGKHVIDEGLETGDYIVNRIEDETHLSTDTSSLVIPTDLTPSVTSTHMIVIGITDPSKEPARTFAISRMYGGIYSGLIYLGFSDADEAGRYLRLLDKEAAGETVYTMFLLPYSVAEWDYKERSVYVEADQSSMLIKYYTCKSESYRLMDTLTANVNNAKYFKYAGSTTTANAYVAHNNKLYTSPYSYLMLSDNNGGVNVYRYEYFEDKTNCTFKIHGTVSQGGSISAVPVDYKGRGHNYNETLDMAKFPTCSWTTDTYTNWLTQTAVSRANQRQYLDDKYKFSQGVKAVGTIASSIGAEIALKSALLAPTAGTKLAGAALGGVTAAIGGVAGLISGNRDYEKAIADMEATEYEHSLVPSSAKNGGATPEVNFALGNFEYYLNSMSITGEYAKKIDGYFDRFGYKVARNDNIVQAITARSKWNYVKTAECNIKADIPDENLNEIKAMFNKGITIWKNPNEIFRYDLGAQNV